MDIKADSINLLPASYNLESSSKFKDSGFGDLMKSNGEESSSNYNLAISTLSAKDISLSSNTINALASVIEATNVDINTKLLNLVSAKSTSVNTTLSNNAGVLTATIKTKGKIEEIEIPAIIKVKDKFTLNGKDITDKLDTTAFKAINDSLNSEEFKEGVIRELRSNSNTPIDEETINQVKALLNSKEWEDKTTTLSGMGALIITAIVTFLTAGAVTAVAGALGAAASSTASAAISAMTTAVIANSTVQLTNNLLSHGKVKFDTSSLAKSAISAGVGSYVSNYISSISTLSNTNIINTPTYTFSYADLLSSTSNAAINSAIYKTNFKDALLSNLISKATDNAYKAVGSYSSNEANINSNALFKESGLGKIALHSAVGALSAKLSHENVAAGALSGAVNEAISSALHKDTSNMSAKEIEAYNNKRLLASQLIGIIAGGIANGDKGANTGYKITTSADTYNRQLHQRETDKIKELSEIYAKEKSISLDKATSIVAKAYYSSVDSDANDFYINNLSSDESIEILKAKEFIQDNLNSPNNHLVNGNDISNTSKKEYYDRYSNLQGYNDNKDFYKKYLSIKNQDDTLKFSSLDLASGFIKPYKDTFSYIVSDPLNSSKDILLGVINPIGSGYEYGHHLREIYEKASLDSFLKDEAGYNKHGDELAGNAVPTIALGGKGVKLVKDKLESAVIKQFDELNDGFKYSIPRTNSIANETLNKIENIVEYARKNNGTPPVGFKGGKVYSNFPKNGEQKLPDGVAYREYDINPYIKGVNRGSERIVIGSDKSIWYSFDHYKSFIRIE